MTPELKSEEFKKYGCIPRCLMYLSAQAGKPLSEKEFCERFETLFPSPVERYGYLETQSTIEILRLLGLASRLRDSDDYAVIETAFVNERKMILIKSTVDLNHGQTNPIDHCSVLMAISAKGFSVWTPAQDGQNYQFYFMPEDWKGKGCTGFVLCQYGA